MKPALSSRSSRRRAALKEVLACERRLTVAERTGDGPALRALLTRDFVGCDFRGRTIDRTRFIAGLQQPELHIAALYIDQLNAGVVGKVVIVTGRAHFTGTLAGYPISGTSLFWNTWVRRAGSWRLSGSAVVQ